MKDGMSSRWKQEMSKGRNEGGKEDRIDARKETKTGNRIGMYKKVEARKNIAKNTNVKIVSYVD